MSTKIYVSYKVPMDKLSDTILVMRKQMIDYVNKTVDGYIDEFDKSKFTNQDFKEMNFDDVDKNLKMKWIIFKKLSPLIFEASNSNLNDDLNLTCFINIWIVKNSAYIIPGFPGYMKKFGRLPKWCKDFAYWDNTDPDDRVSNSEWNERKKLWNYITDENRWDSMRISSIICEKSDFGGNKEGSKYSKFAMNFQKRYKLGWWRE